MTHNEKKLSAQLQSGAFWSTLFGMYIVHSSYENARADLLAL
jgi:hypothetical protein